MRYIFTAVFLLCAFADLAQERERASFKVIPLGVRGGLDESNLSAYMIGTPGSQSYVCADAGTLRCGIEKSIRNKVFNAALATVFRRYIKAYLVSHGHLDHVSGLIINSPDDTSKPIYAMPYVIDVLKEKYFTWQSWANFADQGEKPALGKYHYEPLQEDSAISIANTDLSVTAFSLSHSAPYQSTAFLVQHAGNYLLYFGDTGADDIEKSEKLMKVWRRVAPLVRSGKLKAILIEVSFSNEQPVRQLFGHLTPLLLVQELGRLGELAGRNHLRNLPVVVTHIKPAAGAEARIKAQLRRNNALGLKFIFPEQGVALKF